MWASNYKVGKVTKFFHTKEKFFQAVERFFQAVERFFQAVEGAATCRDNAQPEGPFD